MKIIASRSVDIPLEVAEAYHLKAFGQQVKLEEMFDLSVLPELLSRVDWAEAIPVFIPTVNNREAVDSQARDGVENKPYEEVDVMKYTGSEASATPRLLLINRSPVPDEDTMGVSPNDLVKRGCLWLPLKGYAVAVGVNHEVMDEYLDSKTVTWFPGETLSSDVSAYGLWNTDHRQVRFGWHVSEAEYSNFGARLAIEVPFKVPTCPAN